MGVRRAPLGSLQTCFSGRGGRDSRATSWMGQPDPVKSINRSFDSDEGHPGRNCAELSK